MNTAHKVIETKITLSSEQKERLNTLLDTLKWVWNRGLAILEWDEYYSQYLSFFADDWKDNWGFDLKPVVIKVNPIENGKKKPVWAKYCEIEQEFRIDRTKSWDRGNIQSIPCVQLVKSHWVTPLDKEWYSGDRLNPKKAFAKCRCDDPRLNVKGISSWISDFCDKVLVDNWKAYKKGARKKPRYKRKRDKINTLILRRSGDNIKLINGKITIPYLGTIKGVKLAERLPKNCEVVKLAITYKASGIYLQLTIEEPVTIPDEKPDKIIGFNIGCPAVFTSRDSNGKHRRINSKQYLERNLKKLAHLQKQLARQKRGSSNYHKTQEKIALLHEKIARQRRAYNHKLSHDIVQDYGVIICEDINLQKLTARKEAIPLESAQGYAKNGQERQSDLNRGLLDNGLGQLRTMIEEKAKRSGSLFYKIKPQNTSQLCNNCGHIHPDNRIGLQKFKCVKCGHEAYADYNASINILGIGIYTLTIYTILVIVIKYPSLIGEFTTGGILSRLFGNVPIVDASAREQVKQ